MKLFKKVAKLSLMISMKEKSFGIADSYQWAVILQSTSIELKTFFAKAKL